MYGQLQASPGDEENIYEHLVDTSKILTLTTSRHTLISKLYELVDMAAQAVE